MVPVRAAGNGVRGVLTGCEPASILPASAISHGGCPLHEIDIEYLGQTQAIAACVLETAAGLIVVDPGPSRSLLGLEHSMTAAGFALDDVRALLLTHIHLDHAGAAGSLVQRIPDLRVYVHARGAPHLVDPTRLLASALRIYGDQLDALFGPFLPVAQHRIVSLQGGETLALGGRVVRVEYAPGHAWHHVAYLDERTGTAFVGDSAGERFRPSTYVLPVTPPPDIDLGAWHTTLERIRAWQPAALFLTHFGAFPDSLRHLDELESRLRLWADRVRASLADAGTDEQRADRFVELATAELRAEVPPDVAQAYLGGGLRDSWFGLARHARRHA